MAQNRSIETNAFVDTELIFRHDNVNYPDLKYFFKLSTTTSKKREKVSKPTIKPSSLDTHGQECVNKIRVPTVV